MKANIEIVYFMGCPNASKIFELLKSNGIPFGLVIQDRLSKDDPKRAHSSPSVLVNGVQVFGTTGSDAAFSCTWSGRAPDEILGAIKKTIGEAEVGK